MRAAGDCPGEMRRNRSHDDAFEAALAGRKTEPDALSQFVAAVRADAAATPEPHIGPALAAVLEGDLAVEPSNQPVPLRRKKKMPIPVLLSTAAAKLAAAGVAVTLGATGAAAATDNLPPALQERVASAVEAVTPLNVPGNDDVNVADHGGNATSDQARTNEGKAETFVQDIDTTTPGAVGTHARDTFQPETPAPADQGNNPPVVNEEGEEYDADSNPGDGYRPATEDDSEGGAPADPGGDYRPDRP